ncbi:GGDEF domain-containing protein [Kineococcus sp. SYSU DK002]|uniref:GGDEF domain-containing protein n=1 Tax=Kineococcus sp. SYSU DK002 TaxID=3383123 RepID=UPI003D7D7C26
MKRTGGPAVVAGRALLVVTGLVLALTAPLLGPSPGDWTALAALAVALVAALVASAAVPWHRLPERAPLAFPLAQVTGLAVLGHAAGDLAATCAPLFFLSFVHVGLHLPRRTAWWLLPAAAPLHLLAGGHLDPRAVAGTAAAACVWVLVAEVLADLTRRHRATADHLTRDARTDALTTIGNRRDLEDRMTLLGPGDTVVVCDLDHFKQLNDTHGHARGDQVLREFGAMLAGGLRRGDYAARFGGEEFVLLLHGSGTGPALDVVDRLRHTWAARGGATTFSAGCATLDDATTAEQALVAADAALYAAKRAGRDCTRSAEAADGWGPRVGTETTRQR